MRAREAEELIARALTTAVESEPLDELETAVSADTRWGLVRSRPIYHRKVRVMRKEAQCHSRSWLGRILAKMWPK